MFCSSGYSTEGSANPSEVPRERNDANKVVITLPDGRTHTVNPNRDPAHWIADLVKEFRKACRENEAWNRTASEDLVRHCRQGATVYYSPSIGAIASHARPCKMWDCRDCGPHKAAQRLEHLLGITTRLYADDRSMWFAEALVQDNSALKKMRCRIRTNARGKRASYFTARTGSMLAVLATADISGYKEPTSMTHLDLPDVISKLVKLLSMPLDRPEVSPWDVEPRYRPFTQSRDWRLPKYIKDSDWRKIAITAYGRIPHDVAHKMGYELGTKIRPNNGMSVEEFVRQFAERVNEKDNALYRAGIAEEEEDADEDEWPVDGVWLEQ